MINLKKSLLITFSAVAFMVVIYGCGDSAPTGTTLPTLSVADLNTTSPCPTQTLLTDATFVTNLKAATGLTFYYNAGFNTNDLRCNRGDGFVAASTETELNVGDFTTFILGTAGGGDGILRYGAGGCGTNTSVDSFPTAGTYRWDGKFTANAKTYRLRVRITVSGTSAGVTFASLGVTNLESLVYKIGSTTLTPDSTMFTTIAGNLPSFTLNVELADGTAVMDALVEVICIAEVS